MESAWYWTQQVGLLNDLRQGPAHYGDLVAAGEAVVSPLEALLRGPTETVEQPRQLAAEILGDIAGNGCEAAACALHRALEDSLARWLSPQLQESEDLIASIMARCLGRVGARDALASLMRGLRQRRLPGCAEALGLLQHAPAIPALIDCLQDDVARPDAMAALRRFGPAAVPLLADWLQRWKDDPGQTNVLARVSVAQLLGGICSEEAGTLLSQLLGDGILPVRRAAAAALLRSAPSAPAVERAIGILVDTLEDDDWQAAAAAADGLREAVAGLGSKVVAALDARIRERADSARILALRRRLAAPY